MRSSTMQMAQWKASEGTSKNLFDISTVPISTNTYGLTITRDLVNQTITINGSMKKGSISYGTVSSQRIDFSLDINAKYSLSIIPLHGTITHNENGKGNAVIFTGAADDMNATSINWIEAGLQNEFSKKENVSATKKYHRGNWLYITSLEDDEWIFDNYTFRVQLEKSPVVTTYESYKASLKYENCKGGYVSTDKNYSLAVVGKTYQENCGKNIYKCSGFSAQGMSSPISKKSLSNSYGTTINSIEPIDKLIVTQETVGNVNNPGYAANGYFIIPFSEKMQFEKTIVVSFDYKITNKLIENVNNFYFFINGGGSAGSLSVPITDDEGHFISTPFIFKQNKQKPEAKYLEIRCQGMSLEISNIQVIDIKAQTNNLLPRLTTTTNEKNGVTWVVNNDGSITVSGTPTGYSSIGLTNKTTVKPNTKYLLCFDTILTDKNIGYDIVFSDKDKKQLSALGGKQNKEITFTTPEDTVYLGIFLKRYENNVEIPETTLHPILIDLSYEPYYLSSMNPPTPDNPVEMQCVKKKSKVIVRGNNLFKPTFYSATNTNNKTNATISNNYGTTINSIEPTEKLIITQNMADSLSGPLSYYNGYFVIPLENDNLCIEGKQYILSFDYIITNNLIEDNHKLRLFTNGIGVKDFDVDYQIGIKNRSAIKYVYIKNNMYPNRRVLEIRNAGMSLEISNIMITPVEETNQFYESYIEPQTLISPCDLYEGDIWYPQLGKVVRNNYELTLTGDEKNIYGHTMGGIPEVYISLTNDKIAPSVSTEINCKCSHFKGESREYVAKHNENECSAGGTYIRLHSSDILGEAGKTGIEYASEFKTFLKQQYDNGTPVKIVYKLAEPIVETVEKQMAFLPRKTAIIEQEPINLYAELNCTHLVRR